MDRRLWDILNTSFFLNVRGRKQFDMPISQVLDDIRNGAYAKDVALARTYLCAEDKIAYDCIKSQLPAVTFSGAFLSGHTEKECVQYNSVIVIDIDHLQDEELDTVRDSLEKDPYIATFWLSPSGKGYKGLMSLVFEDCLNDCPTPERHRIAFKQVFKYLLSNYDIQLDRSGQDISRLCFISYDPDICIKETFESFQVHFDETPFSLKDKETKPMIPVKIDSASWKEIEGKATGYANNAENREILTYIYKKLKSKDLSITNTWENWVKVAFSIASCVHPKKGHELFLDLCRLDHEKHDEEKSEHLIWDAYRKNLGKCSMKTILYLARQQGIVIK
jgi:hypothetical protein